MIHGLFATIGHDALSVAQVVVPAIDTLTSALGTLALRGMSLVYVSCALRGGSRFKAALHLLAFPTSAAATMHGFWSGHGRPIRPTCSAAS